METIIHIVYQQHKFLKIYATIANNVLSDSNTLSWARKRKYQTTCCHKNNKREKVRELSKSC